MKDVCLGIFRNFNQTSPEKYMMCSFQRLAESLQNLDSNPGTLIKCLHCRLFLDSQKTLFWESVFVELTNFDLQARNVRAKSTHLVLGIFEISEYAFFISEHF